MQPMAWAVTVREVVGLGRYAFKKGLLTLVNNYAMRNVEQVPFTVTAQ